ncbi:MAG: methyltransferase domain-containing protein [Solirubrobacterales bacterium]
MAIKQGQRAIWSSGDYPDLARYLTPASEDLVDRLEVRPGTRLLDVGTGTGNVAIPAAQRGGSVTGLDITPELLEVARDRAAAADVSIEWIEGDAEELPFGDGAFDRVASNFGMIFAPRHEVAAAEIARVCAPGGRFALTAWTPAGMNGEMFAVIGKHMPPPPPGFVSPVLWGDEQHAREAFAGTGAELSFDRAVADFTGDSPDAWVSYCERALGPMLMARTALEPAGEWDALRADLVALYERFNVAGDGSFRGPAEYLVITGEMPAG